MEQEIAGVPPPHFAPLTALPLLGMEIPAAIFNPGRVPPAHMFLAVEGRPFRPPESGDKCRALRTTALSQLAAAQRLRIKTLQVC